jgi:hypothetical protein
MAPGRSSIGDLDPAALVRNSDRFMVIARPGGHPWSPPWCRGWSRLGARRPGAASPRGRLDPALLFLLDEVCKVCPLPQLPELVQPRGELPRHLPRTSQTVQSCRTIRTMARADSPCTRPSGVAHGTLIRTSVYARREPRLAKSVLNAVRLDLDEAAD